MRPASTVEVKCHLCTEVFSNIRAFKNHLTATPHRRLAVMCPWCPEERPYRRVVDLKDHTKIAHRSKLDVMPPAFFSENNGFWLSFYPADYLRVIKPSLEASEEAIKARREIRYMVDHLKNPSRSLDDWEEGWRQDGGSTASKRAYSPASPEIYEDLTLITASLTPGNTTVIFVLDLERCQRWFKLMIDDAVFADPRCVNSIVRRMAVAEKSEAGIPEINEKIENKRETSEVMKSAARKLGIQEGLITTIYKSTVEFSKKRRSISPLVKPSTSNIILEDRRWETTEDRNNNVKKSVTPTPEERKDQEGTFDDSHEERLRDIEKRKIQKREELVRHEQETRQNEEKNLKEHDRKEKEKDEELRKAKELRKKEEEELREQKRTMAERKEEQKREENERQEQRDEEYRRAEKRDYKAERKIKEAQFMKELEEAKQRDEEKKLEKVKEERSRETPLQIVYEERPSIEQRAKKLLRTGCMPLFPAARRDWDEEEAIQLSSDPLIRWPPTFWRDLEEEEKLTAWMSASSFLEAKSGRPFITNQGNLLDKYSILALPGTLVTKGKSNSHLRLENFNVIRNIAVGKFVGKDANEYLEIYKEASKARNTDVDWLVEAPCDIPLRLSSIPEETL